VTVSGDVAHQTLTLDFYLERAEPAPMTLFKLTHQHVCDLSFAYAEGCPTGTCCICSGSGNHLTPHFIPS